MFGLLLGHCDDPISEALPNIFVLAKYLGRGEWAREALCCYNLEVRGACGLLWCG